MKKLLTVVILSAGMGSCAVQAQHHHGYYRGGYGYGWVAPAIIGGAIGYGLARPYYNPSPTVVYTQPPVYVQQPNPAYTPPMGFHWENILDANCNCYKTVLVPN